MARISDLLRNKDSVNATAVGQFGILFTFLKPQRYFLGILLPMSFW